MPGNKIITNAKSEVSSEETIPHGPPSEMVLGRPTAAERTRAEGAPAPPRVTQTRISEQRQQQESDSKSSGRPFFFFSTCTCMTKYIYSLLAS